jgi:hypothetical protein
MACLAILVPVYQREQGALRAVRSVVSQAGRYLDRGQLSIQLRDDASPTIDAKKLTAACHSLDPRIQVDINSSNLGMSANIRLMVQGCTASFCTILTDDDWLEPGSIDLLMEIIERLEGSSPHGDTAAICCPRYSYTEVGRLVSISCRIAPADQLFAPSPHTAMTLADKGYILTGLVFRPDRVDQNFWCRHQENAFFPILYFASLLCRGSCQYLDRPLVHHTVLNHCYWETWGATPIQQQQRLCRDFLTALHLVHGYLKPRCASQAERVLLWQPLVRAYLDRLVEMRWTVLAAPLSCIPRKLWMDVLFLLAFSRYVYFMVRTGRCGTSHRQSL